MWNWWNSIVSGETPYVVNPPRALLIERSLQNRLGELTAGGALVVRSGKFTGRAAEDKYVVEDDYALKTIDWKERVRPLKLSTFNEMKEMILRHINIEKPQTYIMERSVGADPQYALGVRLITTSPVHALFASHIFRAPHTDAHALGEFTIYHDPHLEFDDKKFGLRSTTAIAISFETREILIAGTAYCGEVKKAIFTVMNTLLPDRGVLPMHTGASMNHAGEVSLFFGLSGTGKTTLSTDEGMRVIGDDEHGLSDRGTFNFEGGCYAKTYGLSEETEPQIFRASTVFGSLLENVVLDEKRIPNFNNKEITENGRSTYPLSSLEDFVSEGRGGVPSHMFFLSADALGVLPAVAKLNQEQAMYFFLSGYTAKLGGTEAGLKGINTTFSHCFGAPFMMRRPMDYGLLLKDFLSRHNIGVWLINTGWYGGQYGVGERYKLKLTRSIIRSIQAGKGANAQFETEPVFGLQIPVQLGDVEKQYLNPRNLWKESAAYDKAAALLKAEFDENFQKYQS